MEALRLLEESHSLGDLSGLNVILAEIVVRVVLVWSEFHGP